MRTFLRFAIIVIAALLQTSLLPYLRPFGVIPNLVLIVVILAALTTTASRSIVMAVIGGITLDLVSGAAPGLATFSLVTVALLAILARRYGLEVDSVIGLSVLIIAGTILVDGLQIAWLRLDGGVFSVGAVTWLVAREALVNTIIALLLRWGLVRFNAPSSRANWRRVVA